MRCFTSCLAFASLLCHFIIANRALKEGNTWLHEDQIAPRLKTKSGEEAANQTILEVRNSPGMKDSFKRWHLWILVEPRDWSKHSCSTHVCVGLEEKRNCVEGEMWGHGRGQREGQKPLRGGRF